MAQGKTATSSNTIEHLFAMPGLPKFFITGNGAKSTSEESK